MRCLCKNISLKALDMPAGADKWLYNLSEHFVVSCLILYVGILFLSLWTMQSLLKFSNMYQRFNYWTAFAFVWRFVEKNKNEIYKLKLLYLPFCLRVSFSFSPFSLLSKTDLIVLSYWDFICGSYIYLYIYPWILGFSYICAITSQSSTKFRRYPSSFFNETIWVHRGGLRMEVSFSHITRGMRLEWLK